MQKLEKFTADQKSTLPEYQGKLVLSSATYLGHSEYSKGSAWYIWQLGLNYYMSLNNYANQVWKVSEQDANRYLEYDELGNVLTKEVEKTYSDSEVKDIAIAFNEWVVLNHSLCMLDDSISCWIKNVEPNRGEQYSTDELFSDFISQYNK